MVILSVEVFLSCECWNMVQAPWMLTHPATSPQWEWKLHYHGSKPPNLSGEGVWGWQQTPWSNAVVQACKHADWLGQSWSSWNATTSCSNLVRWYGQWSHSPILHFQTQILKLFLSPIYEKSRLIPVQQETLKLGNTWSRWDIPFFPPLWNPS